MRICMPVLLVSYANFVCRGMSSDDKVQQVSSVGGKSVILNTDIIKTQNERIKWYYNGKRIAVVTGDDSQVCTEYHCKEIFRDRLKVDNQTGSLTITNTRTTDSGVYELQLNSRNTEKTFNVTIHGFLGADTDRLSVFVMEGDSVTLNTNLEMNQQDRISWYFNRSRITEILSFQTHICTNDQCQERFRDRLKVDNQTGSLTITNTRTTDSGEYQLLINSRNIEKNFIVAVYGVVANDDMKRKTVMEGESVTLGPGGLENSIHLNAWYFNDIFIAKMTGNQIQICTDDECKDIFRDRLKVDHQTGSLTITNINPSHSGLYNLHMSSSSFKIKRTFAVIVTGALSISGLTSGAIGGICVGVLLVFGAAGLIFFLCRHRNGNGTPQSNQVNGALPSNQTEIEMTGNETSPVSTAEPLMQNDENSFSNPNETDMTNTTNAAFSDQNIPFIDADVDTDLVTSNT